MAVEGNANEEARFPPPLERFRVVVPDRAQPCRTEGFSRQQLKHLENWHRSHESSVSHRLMIDWVSTLPIYDYPLYGLVLIFLICAIFATLFAHTIYAALKSGEYGGGHNEDYACRKNTPKSFWFHIIKEILKTGFCSFMCALTFFIFFTRIWKLHLS